MGKFKDSKTSKLFDEWVRYCYECECNGFVPIPFNLYVEELK